MAVTPSATSRTEDPSPATPPGAFTGGRWGWLKVVFAAGILVIVARAVPWQDTLLWTAEGTEFALDGTIVGDWAADSIEFELAPETLASAGLSSAVLDELSAAMAGGTRLPVERSETVTWRPGMPRVFRGLDPRGLGFAILLFGVSITATATRWWRLLCAAGCPTSWFNAVRLTFLGFFFNIVIPGLTGGDVVKAVLVAREHPERKAGAVVSVAVDRLIGVFILATLGAGVILALGDTFAAIRTPVLLCVSTGILGSLVYFSTALRRLVRFDAIVAKLPMSGMVKQLDEAVLVYRQHPLDIALAMVFSVINHMAVFGAIWVIARAFGEQVLGGFEMFALVSVGNIVSALPVAPGGWGVGEAVFGYLFEMLGSSATIGVATSVTFRLLLMAVGLLGGLFLLLPGAKVAVGDVNSL